MNGSADQPHVSLELIQKCFIRKVQAYWCRFSNLCLYDFFCTTHAYTPRIHLFLLCSGAGLGTDVPSHHLPGREGTSPLSSSLPPSSWRPSVAAPTQKPGRGALWPGSYWPASLLSPGAVWGGAVRVQHSAPPDIHVACTAVL